MWHRRVDEGYSYRTTDIAHLSRHVSDKVKVPHPSEAETEFIEFLIKSSDRWRGALILATDDDGAVSIAKNKEILSQHYVVAGADWKAAQTFVEKDRTYKLAEECGVPYPKTFYVEDSSELRDVAPSLTYPCILKPL